MRRLRLVSFITLALTFVCLVSVSAFAHPSSRARIADVKCSGLGGPVCAHDDYGYPYPNAPDCNESTGANCVADQWKFFQGQCTSWVAYRLNQLNGIPFNNSYGGPGIWGNGGNWGTHAMALGIPVNGTPAAGSVAWWTGSLGHVAYVESVNSPTSIVISEMNYDLHNGFWVHTITTSSGWPSGGFIHIHDVVGPGSSTHEHSDFNGDGYDDIAFLRSGISFAMANGSAGGLYEAGTQLPGWSTPDWGGVGDFNGTASPSGHPYDDIAFLRSGVSFAMAYGGPNGLYEAGTQLPGWSTPTWGGVGNFNCDHSPSGQNYDDIAFFRASAGNFAMAYGGPNGLVEKGTQLSGWGTPVWAGVGDFNGSGCSDIAFLTGAGSFAMAYGSSNGLVEKGTQLSGWGQPLWGGVGDFNCDGYSDIAFLTSAGSFAMAYGGPNGLVEKGTQLSGWAKPTIGMAGDFNGNGCDDIAFFNASSGSFAMAYGSLNGLVEKGTQLSGWATPDWSNGWYPGQIAAGWPRPAPPPLPTVASFSPSSGPTGTQVDVQGTNFTGAGSVTFNGTPDPSFVVNSSSDITAHVPSGATTGPIAVTTAGGTGTSSTNFTVTPPLPVVSSFAPSSGPVGTNVSITGTGFTGATAVTFNGTGSSFTVNSDTSINATVPGGATTGPIAVTTPGGTGTSSSSFTVTTSPPPPTVTSFAPTSGPVGTGVSITGTGFTGATSVKFNGTSASYTVNSDTSISATVPAGAATGPLAVTTPNGTGTSASSFTVTTATPPPTITSFSPTLGHRGSSVTINGTNFTGATSVKLGAAATTFTVNSATRITAKVPNIANGFYKWQVTTPGGTATSTGTYRVW